jgi:hypothetical protein
MSAAVPWLVAHDEAGDEHVIRPTETIDARVLNVGYAETARQ